MVDSTNSQASFLGTAGAIVAGLFMLPTMYLGGLGLAVVSTTGAWEGILLLAWSIGACAGCYELFRSQLGWNWGSQHRKMTLFCGIIALNVAMIAIGALGSLLFLFTFPMAAAAIDSIPLISFKKLAFAASYVLSFAVATWLYFDRILAKELVDWVDLAFIP